MLLKNLQGVSALAILRLNSSLELSIIQCDRPINSSGKKVRAASVEGVFEQIKDRRLDRMRLDLDTLNLQGIG